MCYVKISPCNMQLLWLGTSYKSCRYRWIFCWNYRECIRLVFRRYYYQWPDFELCEWLWSSSSSQVLFLPLINCPSQVNLYQIVHCSYFCNQWSTVTKYCCRYNDANLNLSAHCKHGSWLSNLSQGWCRGWH